MYTQFAVVHILLSDFPLQQCVLTAGLPIAYSDPVDQTPVQLHPAQPQSQKNSSEAVRPEFFVIVADSATPGVLRPTVVPPPAPKPQDTTDWGFFWLGFIFQLSWVIGCLRPVFRQPHFPQRQNLMGWIGNLIGERCSENMACFQNALLLLIGSINEMGSVAFCAAMTVLLLQCCYWGAAVGLLFTCTTVYTHTLVLDSALLVLTTVLLHRDKCIGGNMYSDHYHCVTIAIEKLRPHAASPTNSSHTGMS